MKNIYGFRLPYGTLILYGDNMKVCVPYIDNTVNSVEDVCKYCSHHNLRVLHQTHCSLSGLIEHIRVYRLINKYSIRGSWKEISRYFENSR